MAKKRFFASHSKSSAMVISLSFHAIIAVVAILVVAVKVILPEDPDFQVKKVTRPTMPPKKIQVPVNVKKRKPKPRLRKRIVVNKKTFTDIQMPEISGIKGGLGNMGEDGIGGIGFDIEIGDLFGGDKSMGNELTGTFYDLKQTKEGKPSKLGVQYAKALEEDIRTTDAQAIFYEELARFNKGWNLSRLDAYFKAPKKKYATFFMIPNINSSEATEAFGVSEVVTPDFWAAYYEGHIAASETGHYRFCGYGDDILLVRINKRLVIDASFEPYKPDLHTNWTSDDEDNQKYPIDGDMMYHGDWFKMTKGRPVKMEVLIGDVGGRCSSRLLIQKKGVKYREVSFSYTKGKGEDAETITGIRPVLPVFKTKEVPSDPNLIKKMKIDPNQATLEGPIFGAAKEKSY